MAGESKFLIFLLVLTSGLAACEPDPILDNPEAALPDYGAAVPPIFIWPLSGTADADWIAGAFTPRWKVSENRYDFHQALDLVPRVTDKGVEKAMIQDEIKLHPPLVHAVAEGVVHKLYAVGSNDGYLHSGNVVILRHRISGTSDDQANLYYTYYFHLKDWCGTQGCLKEGDEVAQGAEIGHLGNTAEVGKDLDFSHLHFEVRGYPFQFYAKNPLRYLPHENNNGYQPVIVISKDLPEKCNSPFDPQSPLFWVSYRADRDEIDVNQVFATVTNLADPSSTEQIALLDLERRIGITTYKDKGSDNLIELQPEEYRQDDRVSRSWPILDDCGTLRNEFHSDSSEYTMDVQFTGMAGGKKIRIEAQVCDIYGHCESATPVEYP